MGFLASLPTGNQGTLFSEESSSPSFAACAELILLGPSPGMNSTPSISLTDRAQRVFWHPHACRSVSTPARAHGT